MQWQVGSVDVLQAPIQVGPLKKKGVKGSSPGLAPLPWRVPLDDLTSSDDCTKEKMYVRRSQIWRPLPLAASQPSSQPGHRQGVCVCSCPKPNRERGWMGEGRKGLGRDAQMSVPRLDVANRWEGATATTLPTPPGRHRQR